MEPTFTDNIESVNYKLQKAFDAVDFSQNVTLTCKEAIALKCLIDTLKGQNERLTEEINQLETKLLHG